MSNAEDITSSLKDLKVYESKDVICAGTASTESSTTAARRRRRRNKKKNNAQAAAAEAEQHATEPAAPAARGSALEGSSFLPNNLQSIATFKTALRPHLRRKKGKSPLREPDSGNTSASTAAKSSQDACPMLYSTHMQEATIDAADAPEARAQENHTETDAQSTSTVSTVPLPPRRSLKGKEKIPIITTTTDDTEQIAMAYAIRYAKALTIDLTKNKDKELCRELFKCYAQLSAPSVAKVLLYCYNDRMTREIVLKAIEYMRGWPLEKVSEVVGLLCVDLEQRDVFFIIKELQGILFIAWPEVSISPETLTKITDHVREEKALDVYHMVDIYMHMDAEWLADLVVVMVPRDLIYLYTDGWLSNAQLAENAWMNACKECEEAGVESPPKDLFPIEKLRFMVELLRTLEVPAAAV